MADSKKSSALKAYFDEAADSFLAGQGDELSAIIESIPSTGSVVDKASYGERLSRNLERRRGERQKLQDEHLVAAPLGSLTGTVLSPMSRVMSLPARMTTSAIEEVGRSDPESALDYLKALALGAGQGAMQHAAPGVAAEAVKLRKRSAAKGLPFFLDLTQSNAFPGAVRQAEAQRKKEEEALRAKAQR